jgi:hypothetical protein
VGRVGRGKGEVGGEDEVSSVWFKGEGDNSGKGLEMERAGKARAELMGERGARDRGAIGG